MEAVLRAEKLTKRYGELVALDGLDLQVERRNAEALAFYGACGFSAHHRIPLSKRLGSAD